MTKYRRDILGVRSTRPIPGPLAKDSSARKTSPHNFWLQNPAGLSQWKKHLETLAVPLIKPTTRTRLLRLIPSELQHQGSSLNSTSGIQGEAEVAGIKVSRGYCPFAKPSLHRAGATSKTPSTSLTLLTALERSPEALPHPIYGPTLAAFP